MIKVNKNYISDAEFYASFDTRLNKPFFKSKENQELFKLSISNYLEDNDISIKEYYFDPDGYRIILRIVATPLVANANIVYNLKKLSAAKLIKEKANRLLLKGEHAIWTRKYLISNSREGIENLIKVSEDK